MGLVEVRAAPAGAQVEVAGETRVAGSRGTFFLVPPGEHDLAISFPGQRLEKRVRLSAGERVTLAFLSGSARPTSALVLPGKAVGLDLTVTSPFALPYVEAELVLPLGWEAEPGPGMLDPVPAEVSATRRWVLRVPAEAQPGSYRLVAQVFGVEIAATVQVVEKLPPLLVVAHWDVNRNELDLASPFALTYARALWAASLLGKPIPYADQLMTKELLAQLLERWASGEGG